MNKLELIRQERVYIGKTQCDTWRWIDVFWGFTLIYLLIGGVDRQFVKWLVGMLR